MTAFGAFAQTVIDPRSRIIVQSKPKVTPVTTSPTNPLPVETDPIPRFPTSRLPLYPKTVPAPNVDPVIDTPQIFTGPIITETTDNMGGGTTSGGGTSTTTTTSSGGGGGGTEASKLLDVLGSLFQETPVAATMAPVSFASTDVGTGESGAAPAGGSKAGLVILAVVLLGGLFWYVKTHGARS